MFAALLALPSCGAVLTGCPTRGLGDEPPEIHASAGRSALISLAITGSGRGRGGGSNIGIYGGGKGGGPRAPPRP